MFFVNYFYEKQNVKYLDLSTTLFDYTCYTSDGVHPNSAWVQKKAESINNYINKNY